jgi:hypothetical protein
LRNAAVENQGETVGLEAVLSSDSYHRHLNQAMQGFRFLQLVHRRFAMRKLLFIILLLVAGGSTPLMAAEPITDDVAATLQYMREEEKLAHDVYLLFSGMYAGQVSHSKIFAQITESEQRHTDAVKALLEEYGVVDPAAATAAGEFVDDELQALYDTLVEVGMAGFTEALGVGVVIEQKDMTDIVEAIEVSAGYADIVQVYSNLLTGSEHHLSAFLKALDAIESGAASARGKAR